MKEMKNNGEIEAKMKEMEFICTFEGDSKTIKRGLKLMDFNPKSTNITIKRDLTINGMPLGEFQKEIEKLSHLLDEMKQLSVFRDEGEN